MNATLDRPRAIQSLRGALPLSAPKGFRQDRDALTSILLAGIIGCPDGICIARCGAITQAHFTNPVHWRIFSAYKTYKNSPTPDLTWRDTRFISAVSGVPMKDIFSIGELDREALKFDDALTALTHAR
jgi:hypothetical protein